MKLNQYLFSFAVFLLTTLIFTTLVFTSQVNAQVYKCTFIDATTRQNKVVYTDSPCQQAQKQTLTAIQTKSSPLILEALQTAQLAQASALDSAITRAVLNQDYKLAKSLAITKEHWRLIAIAEGAAALPVLTVANNQLETSRADECAQAKYNFEYVSRNSWRDKDLLAAKKSVMHVACGVPEPVQNQPIFIGRAFGGLQAGRWIHPNYLPYQIRPHGSIGQHPYPVNHRYSPNHQHYQGHHSAGNVSLNYKSRHFGINVNGASSFNSTNGFNNTSGFNNTGSFSVR